MSPPIGVAVVVDEVEVKPALELALEQNRVAVVHAREMLHRFRQ